MEVILRLYMLSYNEKRPVVCFDERPCFLIGDRVKGLEMTPGQVAKQDYAYTKHGSCSVLAAIEPKTGKRLVHVRRQRRKIEFAKFMLNLAQIYPDAETVVVVMDNLNTHCKSAFYEAFDAETAAWLSDKLEFVYTPKKASWLNMIEIEFSALSRQCLNRRIPSMNQLAQQVFIYMKERNDKGIKIQWQFDRQKARNTMNKHYKKVNTLNQKYKITSET